MQQIGRALLKPPPRVFTLAYKNITRFLTNRTHLRTPQGRWQAYEEGLAEPPKIQQNVTAVFCTPKLQPNRNAAEARRVNNSFQRS